MDRGDWVFKGRRREGRERGLSRVREVKKCKGLVSVKCDEAHSVCELAVTKVSILSSHREGGERPYPS